MPGTAVANDLSKVLSKKLVADEMPAFLDRMIAGLSDTQASASAGVCVVLNGLFRLRGKELDALVSHLLKDLQAKLKSSLQEQTEIGTLRSLRTLATHHLEVFVTELLAFELPYDPHVVKIWQTLAADANLQRRILDQLLGILTSAQPYVEKRAAPTSPRATGGSQSLAEYSATVREATLPPRQATCALVEILKPEEISDVVMENYARLLSTLLLRVASANGIRHGADPLPDAIGAFRQFIERSKSGFIQEDLELAKQWDELTDAALFPDAMATVAQSVCENNASVVHAMVEFLTPFLEAPYDRHRVAATAIFGEFIGSGCAENTALLEQLMNSLMSRLADESLAVKKLAIRGLGNVASAPVSEVHKYSTTIVMAMMAGMDDKSDFDDDMTLESMSGLAKIMAKLDENNIRPILINICLRIRPCFEKERGAVRAAAVKLFGSLSVFGDGPSKAPYLEQIHANLIALLLHLNDDDEVMRKVPPS